MRALVLGGTGFIGSWVVEELLRNDINVSVVGLPPVPQFSNPGRVRLFVGDFFSSGFLEAALEGCGSVFHVGGYYPVFSVDRERQAGKALRELKLVLDAIERNPVRRFVFTSSPVVLVHEPEALRRSTYHFIKWQLHGEVLRRIEGGLPGVIVVPGACFGPGDWKPTTGRAVVEIANRRLKFILDGKMNAVDVRDVAAGQVLAMRRGKVGSVYQMGNWNCLLSEFVTLAARIANVPIPHIRVPYSPVKIVAQAGEWIQHVAGARRPFLPQVGLDMIHFGAFLDSSLASRELGFAPRPIEQTLRDTLEFFVREHYVSKDRRISRHAMPAAQSPQQTS